MLKSEAATLSKHEPSRNKKFTEFHRKLKKRGAEIWHQNADRVFKTQLKTHNCGAEKRHRDVCISERARTEKHISRERQREAAPERKKRSELASIKQ